MKASDKINQLCALLAVTLVLILLAPLASATAPEDVKNFVSGVYAEGVPYDQASQLDSDVALPILKQVLSDPRAEKHWANAAVITGMIGHDKGADLLIDFITRRETKAKLSRAQTVSKTSAVMSLGYIVNKTGNRKALEFLKTGVDPEAWEVRKLPWTGEFYRTPAEQNNHLAGVAVLGLGLSGNTEAAQTLLSLQEAPGRSELGTLKQIASEALIANTEISSEGLKDYYLTRPHRPNRSQAESTSSSSLGPKVDAGNPPAPGEVLKEPVPGELLAEPQTGEVLANSTSGQVLREPQKGTLIESPK